MLETSLLGHALGLAPAGGDATYWPGGSRPHTYADRAREVVRLAMAQQMTGGADDGLWSGTGALVGIQLNYMAAMLHEALAVYADSGIPSAAERAAIVAAIGRGNAFLWRSQWLGEAGGFNYASKAFAAPAGNGQMLTGGPGPAPDLTAMFLPGFAYEARETADASARAAALARFTTALRSALGGAYLVGVKQFNEFYASSWRAFGWLP
jgi:hypothetical protein